MHRRPQDLGRGAMRASVLTIDGLKVNKDVEGAKTGTATATVKAGTYKFRCEYHPQQMTGTVTVT